MHFLYNTAIYTIKPVRSVYDAMAEPSNAADHARNVRLAWLFAVR